MRHRILKSKILWRTRTECATQICLSVAHIARYATESHISVAHGSHAPQKGSVAHIARCTTERHNSMAHIQHAPQKCVFLWRMWPMRHRNVAFCGTSSYMRHRKTYFGGAFGFRAPQNSKIAWRMAVWCATECGSTYS